ncbi:MAG TPA: hypothetical protein VJI12_02560 [archaeon]|nr:hypothetical protein [archaeon]
MEDFSFETDYNAFRCVECNELIRVEVAEDKPRPITCQKCETVFMVSRSPQGEGLTVTAVTESEPDAVSESERNIEEDEDA